MRASWASGLGRTMVKVPLTKRQKVVFDFVKGFIEQNQFAPSRQEIANAFNFSLNAAQCHVAAIVKKGWLRIIGSNFTGGRVARGLRLT